jgi:hypothetical protein
MVTIILTAFEKGLIEIPGRKIQGESHLIAKSVVEVPTCQMYNEQQFNCSKLWLSISNRRILICMEQTKREQYNIHTGLLAENEKENRIFCVTCERGV